VSDPAPKGHADTTAQGTPTTFLRKGAAWCEVAKLGEPLFRIRLGGLLRTSWMSALCNRLAEARVSVEHAHARLAHDAAWIAELHVFPVAGAADPLRLPYIEFLEGEEPDASPASDERKVLRIDSYRVLESRDYGGTLMLTLEGPDSLGLLGALLAALAGLDLFPVEVHIETRDGRAYDSLWLGAAGGSAPSAVAKEGVEKLMARSASARGSRI
jgi:UTP:GlnB (protein PII) uridylyltransferase